MLRRGLARIRFVPTFFVALFVLLFAVITSVYFYLGTITAIKGAYTILGVSIAALVYRGRAESARVQLDVPTQFSRFALKAVIILVLCAYTATYLTTQRLWITIVVLVIGTVLIGVQLAGLGTTRYVVPQIAALFTVNPVTKYLSTEFYYGETDLFGHVRAIELVTSVGRIDVIGVAYSTYDLFPGMHVTSASISVLTGLPPYDSLLILGIGMYTAVVLIVFYTCSVFLSTSQSVAVTFVFASLNTVQYFSTYFFPQAFATAVLIYLIYMTTRRRSIVDAFEGRLSIASVLFIGVLVFSHHVTQIVFLILFGIIYLPSILRVLSRGRALGINRSVPAVVPMLLALTAGSTYLILSSTAIVTYFVDFTSELIESPFVTDAGGARVVFGFGTEIPYHTPTDAVISLFYLDGVYNIALLALFVVGVVVIMTQYRSYAHIAGFLLLGVVGSLAVLRTPFLGTLSRLSIPLSFFFSLVAGIGLWQLLSQNKLQRVRSATGGIGMRGTVVFLLVVTVGITGPLVAADDLYDLHAGPNLWETYSTPEQQVEFGEQEFEEFESVVTHANQYNSDVTMLWVSRRASSRFTEAERLEPTSVTAEGIRAGSPLVYRTKWTQHQVGYSTDTLGTLSIARWWLDREIERNNKVYSTGGTGILWGETVFLSNEDAGTPTAA